MAESIYKKAKDVALELGTNHNYLSQYINNNLNMTFQVWLNTLRIEESKILLSSNEKISIEEVGIKVGIPQNYNFSRWFKVVTDMTPFQYRRFRHSSVRWQLDYSVSLPLPRYSSHQFYQCMYRLPTKRRPSPPSSPAPTTHHHDRQLTIMTDNSPSWPT